MHDDSLLEALMQGLSFPAMPAPKTVRAALEHAWFERRPLRIRYAGNGGATIRTIRVEGIVLERSLTLINARDLERTRSASSDSIGLSGSMRHIANLGRRAAWPGDQTNAAG
jgi:hypothetical protein